MTQGYIRSQLPLSREVAPREDKVGEVIRVLGEVITAHADLQEAEGSPWWVPPKPCIPAEGEQGATMWVDLYTVDGSPIVRPTIARDRVADLVASAGVIVKEDDDDEHYRVLTVETNPPNVRNHIGEPLDLDELGEVILDFKHYQQALAADTE